MNLEKIKNLYLEDIKLNLTIATYKFYACHLNYTFKYFKNNNILEYEQLTKEIIYNFIIFQKEQNVKNATINKRILALKCMFKFNNIQNRDLENIKKLKEERNTFQALTNDEMNKLVYYLNSNALKFQNKVLIYLLIDTGARISEILAIQKSNINFTNQTIFLEKTKTHQPRYVFFTESTKLLLLQYVKQIDDNYLFHLKVSSVESMFTRIKNKLNIHKLHPHMLRHSLATKLHNNGMSIIVLQKILGHNNISTTERYIHFELNTIISNYQMIMN